MKKFIILISLLFISTIMFSQHALQWRGDQRDGHYPDKNLLKQWPENGPQLLWHFDKLGLGHSSVAVDNHSIYASGTPDTITYIYSFTKDGKLNWKTELGVDWVVNWDGVRTSPMINDGKLYIISAYGLLKCLNSSNGKLIWKIDILNDFDGRNINWGICENLLIDGDKLFCTVGGTEANVIALNKDNGNLVWKSNGNGEKSAYHSPILFKRGNKTIFVTMTEKSIMGFDANTGEHLWSHEQTNRWSVHANTPLYNNGKLMCFSGYGRGAVMLEVSENGESIKELWRNPKLDSNVGGAVLSDGKIFGTGHMKNWFCIDWETGKVLYTKEGKAANLIMADGLLYIYDQGGDVSLVEPTGSEFKLISSFKVPYGIKQHWAHLVIANKKLFVRHGSSLMVYDIAEK